MTRFYEHAAAAIVALLITTATFVPVVTVPATQADTFASAPALA